ncbi:hypothetical protein [Bradyrhizobium sp. BRP56]|uniref:hypothetical protein n=1 Tax=Bradyrhizobium sp. BRP56 TaxID=2793819 RepID=UPI0023EF278C|nr:hypothetical protein [Bradyrhizobium sp. BRP56]
MIAAPLLEPYDLAPQRLDNGVAIPNGLLLGTSIRFRGQECHAQLRRHRTRQLLILVEVGSG